MDHARDYFNRYAEILGTIDTSRINVIIDVLFMSWKHGNHVFIVGNGGSASSASHMACDLGKNTIYNPHDPSSRRFKVTSLTDNVSTMTALGNDLGYEYIYSQQLSNLGRPGDVLIILTGSGNSPNVLKVIEKANILGMVTIGILGFDGGKAKDLVDHCIIWPESNYGRVEDFHIMLNHVIRDGLMRMIEDERKY